MNGGMEEADGQPHGQVSGSYLRHGEMAPTAVAYHKFTNRHFSAGFAFYTCLALTGLPTLTRNIYVIYDTLTVASGLC